MRNALLLLVWCSTVVSQLGFAGENKQKSYESARQRASEVTDIFSGGPLQIQATFHLHLPSGQLDGTYRYTQISKDEYREAIQTTNFSELSIRKAGQQYGLRSRALEPLPVAYLRELIYPANPIRFMPIDKKENLVQNGQDLECYGVVMSAVLDIPGGANACFDSATGMMVSAEWRFQSEAHRLQYSNFLHDGKKLYPGTMVRFHNGTLLAEVTVDSISHEASDEKEYTPPPNAVKQNVCKRFQRATRDDHYWDIIFNSRTEGTVVIAGSLDENGKVQEREIQQSSDVTLNKLALKALKEVLFQPAKCDGHYIPSHFRLQIWFTLGPHADFFESFP